MLDAALGELRAAGWPAPEDPDFGQDAELDGRDSIAGRRSDEVRRLRQCADWLAHLDGERDKSGEVNVPRGWRDRVDSGLMGASPGPSASRSRLPQFVPLSTV